MRRCWSGGILFNVSSATRDDHKINLPFFVLDLGLYVVDCIRRFYFQSDGFAGEGLDEDLHDG